MTTVKEGNCAEEGYEFRFVEVGEPSQAQASRSLVRAHVMRDFYEKRRGGRRRTTQTETSSFASMKEGKSQQIHRFKVGPNGLEEVVKKRKNRNILSVKPPLTHSEELDGTALGDAEYTRTDSEVITVLGKSNHQSINDAQALDSAVFGRVIDSIIGQPGALDPFNTLPLPNSPRTKILLFHAEKGIFSSPWMGHLRKEWLALATQDAALFHIALSHYAGNYGLEHRECDPAEALRFRMESMGIVNKRLERKDHALVDGTIGTVAALSSYEATNGSLSAVRTHMTGLKKMIGMRGGLHNTGMNQYTKRLVLWADLNCANALASDPLFSSHDNNENNLRSTCQENGPCLSSVHRGQPEIDPPGLPTLSKELTDIFAALRRLSTTCPCQRNVDKSVHIQRSDEVYLIERSLLVLSNLSGPRNIITSCCIAGIIFMDNHFRGIDFIARIIGRLVSRLQLSVGLILSDLPLCDTPASTRRAMLWILCVGAISAAHRPGRIYFVAVLAEVCKILGIACWEEAEDILTNFFWPAAWDRESSLLWKDIEKTRPL